MEMWTTDLASLNVCADFVCHTDRQLITGQVPVACVT